MAKHVVHVVNIKCGGCAHKITQAMEKLDLTDVEVSPEEQTVSFNGENVKAAEEKLSKMGYPKADSSKAGSQVKKAQSYVSCAVGRWG